MQRVDNPLNIDPQRLADIYFTWLPSYMKPFIHVNVDGDKVAFSIASYLTILKLIKVNRGVQIIGYFIMSMVDFSHENLS